MRKKECNQFLLIQIRIKIVTKVARTGKMLLLCADSIWFGGTKTFWDIWQLGIILKCKFCQFFFCNFLGQKRFKPPDQNLSILLDRNVLILILSSNILTQNFTWRLNIVQNLCEFCQFFFYYFMDTKCFETP